MNKPNDTPGPEERPFAHYPNTKSQGGKWVPVLADNAQFIKKKLLPGSKGFYRLALKERLAQIGELDYQYFHDEVHRLNVENATLKERVEALMVNYQSPLLSLFGDPDHRKHYPLTEPMRSALQREHSDDWSMEVVAEAAYICSEVAAERHDRTKEDSHGSN